jgi:hypothetical protein
VPIRHEESTLHIEASRRRARAACRQAASSIVAAFASWRLTLKTEKGRIQASPLRLQAVGLPVSRVKFGGLHVQRVSGRRIWAIDIRVERLHCPYDILILEQPVEFLNRCLTIWATRPVMLRQGRLRQAHGFQNCNQLILHASFLTGCLVATFGEGSFSVLTCGNGMPCPTEDVRFSLLFCDARWSGLFWEHAPRPFRAFGARRYRALTSRSGEAHP